MPDGTGSFACKGKAFYHSMGTSTFSEHTVVVDISAAKIDPTVPLDKACLLGCGISTGYSTAANTAKVDTGSICSIFVLEAGELAVIKGCKLPGAFQIIAITSIKTNSQRPKHSGSLTALTSKISVNPSRKSSLICQMGGVDYSFKPNGNRSSPLGNPQRQGSGLGVGSAGQCGGWLSCFR